MPEIENDPQKMNSASLNMKLFSVIILIAPSLKGNKKTVLDIKFENFLPFQVFGLCHFSTDDGRPTSEKKWE